MSISSPEKKEKGQETWLTFVKLGGDESAKIFSIFTYYIITQKELKRKCRHKKILNKEAW